MDGLNARLFLLLILLLSLGLGGCFSRRSPPPGPLQAPEPIGDENPRPEPDPGDASDVLSRGDVVVLSQNTKSILAFDANGEFKHVVYELGSGSNDVIHSLGWDHVNQKVLVLLEGNSRVEAIALHDGAVSTTPINSRTLASGLRGVIQLLSGQYLVLRSSVIERFSADGTYLSLKRYFSNSRIAPTSRGFVLCSASDKSVNTYADDGTWLASVRSEIVGTQDARACGELSSGEIANVWSGASPTVRIYSADLANIVGAYSDTRALASPSCLGVLSNDNILVCDSRYNTLVELNPRGVFVRTWSHAELRNPAAVLEIP